MHRSSESVAGPGFPALGQGPSRADQPGKKSLTATIRNRTGRGGRAHFPLWRRCRAALDIVRKTPRSKMRLRQLQTTAIDQAAGIVNLTTMLAHASGRKDRLGLASYVPSPRQPIPQRHGRSSDLRTAVTALFALVGICRRGRSGCAGPL